MASHQAFRTAAVLQFQQFPYPLGNSDRALLQYQQAQSVPGAAGRCYAARCLWPNARRQMPTARCLQKSLSEMPTPKWTQPSPKLDVHSEIPTAKFPRPNAHGQPPGIPYRGIITIPALPTSAKQFPSRTTTISASASSSCRGWVFLSQPKGCGQMPCAKCPQSNAHSIIRLSKCTQSKAQS